jgi:hypothetical protein
MKNYSPKFKMIFLTVLFLGFFGLAKISQAAIRYVAPNGSGSTCSSASPCSVSTGLSSTSAGDTLIFKNGTYTSSNTDFLYTITLQGNASNWITLKAESKWGAILSGNSNHTSDALYFTYPAKYIRVEDFEFKDFNSGSIYIDSNSNQNPTSWAHHIYLYRLKIHDIARLEDSSPYGNSPIGISNGCTDITVDSCIIYKHGRLNPNTVPSASEGSCTGSDGNSCYNHDHGIYSKATGPVTIINNIFYDIKSGYHIICDGQDPGTHSGYTISNNTFYGINPERQYHINLYKNISGAVIQNNISSDAGSYAIYTSAIASKTNIIIRNNLVYGASLTVSGACSDPEWTCSNNITADPKFVNAANKDFHLQSTSPAINKGLAYSGRTVDADGKSIVGLPDIGAYEYLGQADTIFPSAPTGVIVK